MTSGDHPNPADPIVPVVRYEEIILDSDEDLRDDRGASLEEPGRAKWTSNLGLLLPVCSQYVL
jgi:hypothetical protein